MGLLDAIYGYGEPALGLLSSSAAEPIAGWGGLLGGSIDQIRNSLTYQPKTAQGKQGQQDLNALLSNIGSSIVNTNPNIANAARSYSDAVDSIGLRSPLAGALLQTLPTAALTMIGPGSGPVRTIGKASDKAMQRQIRDYKVERMFD